MSFIAKKKNASRGKGADYPRTWVCKVNLDASISFHLILSFCIICIISEITFGVYIKLWVRNNKPMSEFCFGSSQALSSTSDFIYRYLVTFYTFAVPLIAWYHLLRKHSTYWILSGSLHFRCLGSNIRPCTFLLLNSTACPLLTISRYLRDSFLQLVTIYQISSGHWGDLILLHFIHSNCPSTLSVFQHTFGCYNHLEHYIPFYLMACS